MHCPICKHPTLEQISLEHELPAYQCPNRRGIFFLANEYLRWRLAQSAPSLPSEFQAFGATPTLEVEAAKICPSCGRLMMRYNVLPNGTLYLDRCAGCNSIWCDPQEWDVVVAQRLQYHLNEFFTKPWQSRVHTGQVHRMLDKLYTDKFGANDYAKIKEIYAWLQDNPQRPMLLAYLQSNDPYKI